METRSLTSHVGGQHPTTELLDVQVIGIVLDINWSEVRYWRHVAVEWCILLTWVLSH